MKLSHGNSGILLMDYKLSHIQDGKGKVYGEIRCSAFAGPGITGACMLLCIAYAELRASKLTFIEDVASFVLPGKRDWNDV